MEWFTGRNSESSYINNLFIINVCNYIIIYYLYIIYIMNNPDYTYNIIKLYNDSKFSNRHGLDLLLTIIILIIAIITITYYFVINRLQNIRNNWNKNKCNPLYFPFISIINPDPNIDPNTQISENLKECIHTTIKKTSKSFTNGVFSTFNHLLNFSSVFNTMYSNVMAFFNSMIDLLIQIVTIIMQAIVSILVGITHYLITVKSLFNKLVASIITVFYIIIHVFNIGMAFVLNLSFFLNIIILIPLIISIFPILFMGILSIAIGFALANIFTIFFAIPFWVLGAIFILTVIIIIVIIIIVSILINALAQIESTAKRTAFL